MNDSRSQTGQFQHLLIANIFKLASLGRHPRIGGVDTIDIGVDLTHVRLERAGHRSRPLREEIRANLLERLREGRPLFPGVIGYEDTVVPQVINAVLAKRNKGNAA